ncbi:hypothetical protein [Paeniglutamicibacter kerguelensis]|uniref:Toxin-antitoxin system HicB family antitoxin n=1 Tax=Paeniglutamicibacter kerguelensis TaxID=254788 RepID=A0ABS4XIT4_9MICC|nr:hypothetical protein [Paeniglutamicibacter kerguelensis]MBP2388369.1 hypothetical protein [Paeniglutamicibacter kerguelensis]
MGNLTRSRVGRPSKGDRHVFTTRIPTSQAEKIFAVAKAQGISASDFIADIVLEQLGSIDIDAIDNQTELPIKHAS